MSASGRTLTADRQDAVMHITVSVSVDVVVPVLCMPPVQPPPSLVGPSPMTTTWELLSVSSPAEERQAAPQ
jgi:hypothetical protein